MPVPVALNIAIRNSVRRSMVLPTPPLPLTPDELPPDTDETSLAKLRAARVIPTARQSAQDVAREDEAARRLRLQPPAAGRLVTFGTFTSVAGSSLFAGVSGPISFPFTVAEVYFSSGSTNAAGVQNFQAYTVLASQNDSILLAALQGDPNIIEDGNLFQDGVRMSGVILLGQQPTFITTRPDYANQNQPTFLKAVVTIPAGVTSPVLHAVINESVPLMIPGIPFAPPIGRTTININTAGAAPRTAARPVPRAARVSVTQGGRILSSRVIAWESADPNIRADWFNRQVGGVGDPNIEWIP